jgi:hypothetical protein
MPMFDTVGEDGFSVVGAPAINLGSFLGAPGAPRLAATPANLAAAVAAAHATPAWMKPGVPSGVSTPEEEMDFLPFDEELNNGVFDATHTELRFISLPQRPFRGERLIISAFSSTVSDPLSNIVIDPAVYVGAVQIGSTQGRASATAFAPTAFGVRLSFPRAGQGTRIFIPLATLVTLTGTDKIAVSVQVIGRAVR